MVLILLIFRILNILLNVTNIMIKIATYTSTRWQEQIVYWRPSFKNISVPCVFHCRAYQTYKKKLCGHTFILHVRQMVSCWVKDDVVKKAASWGLWKGLRATSAFICCHISVHSIKITPILFSPCRFSSLPASGGNTCQLKFYFLIPKFIRLPCRVKLICELHVAKTTLWHQWEEPNMLQASKGQQWANWIISGMQISISST